MTAMEAWETVEGIIDMLDCQGVFVDEELDTLEEAMTTILKFIKGAEGRPRTTHIHD